MLAGDDMYSRFMFNALSNKFDIAKVIVEGPIDKRKFIKRRIKKLGVVEVFGQLLFQLIIPRLLKRLSVKRIDELKKFYKLDESPINSSLISRVDSINSKESQEILSKLNPDLILVNGTRIISKRILNTLNATIINTHAGITPQYRGVHGGYWALANKDKENFGVTVHLIDAGIDTGGILNQRHIIPKPADNFCTYTFLQIGEGINIMKETIIQYFNGTLKTMDKVEHQSNLWYHPTIWGYLYKRILFGVK